MVPELTPQIGRNMPTQSIAIHPLIDTIVDEHYNDWSEGDEIGWRGYRNHAQRVYIFAPPTSDEQEVRQIAEREAGSQARQG
jgi:hypothetical protein